MMRVFLNKFSLSETERTILWKWYCLNKIHRNIYHNQMANCSEDSRDWERGEEQEQVNQWVAVDLATGFIAAERGSSGQEWREMQDWSRNKHRECRQAKTKVWEGKRHVGGEPELGPSSIRVQSLVTVPCLSIMGSLVAREKVADMTCSSEPRGRGEGEGGARS